jgi:phytoene dehydrogenase-like protein
MEYEVVVIGAGIGGLTAAALLAKRGLNVCLLERQSFAGGCAALVEHAGHQFEPTHGLYCGWQPDGVFEQLFRELGFPSPRARKLSIPYLVRLPGRFDVPRIGTDDLEDSLQSAFPECADAAIEFFRSLSTTNSNPAEMLSPLESCSAGFRSFVDIQLNALAQCAGVAVDHHLAAMALDPQRSFWEIEGGLQSLVDALVESFKQSGGRLRLDSTVLRLAYDSNGSPVGVDLLNGERLFATRAIISNLTIWDTYGKLIGPGRTPAEVSSVLKRTSGLGSYQMFLTLAASPALPAERILIVTESSEDTDAAETQLAFYRPSSRDRNPAEVTAVVSTYTNADDWFSFHEDLSAFEERDQTMLERIWPRLHGAMPELGDDLQLIETSTPQTFYENTRRRFGMIGRPTSSGAEIVTTTPFPNLWLAGDTAAEGFGIDGIVASAHQTARKITG